MARKQSNRADYNSASAPYGGSLSGPTEHSGLPHWDKAMQKAGGPKAEVKTPWSYSKPNSGPYHPGIGNPMGVNKAEVKSGMGMPAANSGPYHKGMGAPKEPKSWKSKGYSKSMGDE